MLKTKTVPRSWSILGANYCGLILQRTALSILQMADVRGLLAVVTLPRTEPSSAYCRMVVKSSLVPAKGCMLLKTKGVPSRPVVQTPHPTATSSPWCRTATNCWPILAKGCTIQEMMGEVGWEDSGITWNNKWQYDVKDTTKFRSITFNNDWDCYHKKSCGNTWS